MTINSTVVQNYQSDLGVVREVLSVADLHKQNRTSLKKKKPELPTVW